MFADISILNFLIFRVLFLVPLEFPILRRERFNRWYSGSSFFAAFILFDLPVTFVCSTFYVTSTYLLTKQPYEMDRFLLFLSISVILCYAAQGIGFMITVFFNVKVIKMNNLITENLLQFQLLSDCGDVWMHFPVALFCIFISDLTDEAYK